jgi:hypothetical protein
MGSERPLKKEGSSMDQNGAPGTDAALVWRNSGHICALSDGERHLGHVVKIGGRWHAHDATHSNEAGDGFRFLGTFAAVKPAKEAVEQSLSLLPVSLAGAA